MSHGLILIKMKKTYDIFELIGDRTVRVHLGQNRGITVYLRGVEHSLTIHLKQLKKNRAVKNWVPHAVE